MIDLLYNTVSLALWVPFNEGWGQFDALKAAEFIRKRDDTRPIDHASGWYDQGGGDIKVFTGISGRITTNSRPRSSGPSA